ncbi:hypothetical protein ccbrp13_16920 [Ktedonobacteria bacterium brp13]|nr:hypothetical protein ccbrp13_16920 [Ktedonobacteria bacterium brp13]
MSFDLSFWYEDQPITAEQALQVYEQLCESNDTVVKPHPNIALFLQAVSQHYPPISDYPEEKLEECPWSVQWDVTSGSVIFCMTWPAGRNLATHFIQLAHEHDLVCYNPQRSEVYLPPSLLDLQEMHPYEHETASSRPIEVWPSWREVEAALNRGTPIKRETFLLKDPVNSEEE